MNTTRGYVLMRSVSASQMDILSIVKGWQRAGIINGCPIIVREADLEKLQQRGFRNVLDDGNHVIVALSNDACWDVKNKYGLPPPPKEDGVPVDREYPQGIPCPELAALHRDVFETPTGKLFGQFLVDASTSYVNLGAAGECLPRLCFWFGC